MTERKVSIEELDEVCQMTLSDVDIAAIYLRNSLDIPTMKRYGLTHRININQNPAFIELSEDWKLTNDEEPSNAVKL